MMQRVKPGWVIGGLVLVFVIAIPAYFMVRKRRMASDLEAWLPAAGWTPVPCPPGAFGRPMSQERCFDGVLGRHKAMLLLGRRWMGETANIPRNSGVSQEQLVGVALEGVDDEWRERWKRRNPVRLEGGTILFHALWDPDEIEKVLRTVLETL